MTSTEKADHGYDKNLDGGDALPEPGLDRPAPSLITAPLSRAARAALLWSQYDLADRCGVSRVAIADWERGHSRLQRRNLARVQAAFEAAGIVVLTPGAAGADDGHPGPGLRFPPDLPAGPGIGLTDNALPDPPRRRGQRARTHGTDDASGG